jgi:hypothetical protein
MEGSHTRPDPKTSEELTMEKRPLSCASFLLLAALASAPLAAATTIDYGVKAGLSLSNVTWGYDLEADKSVLRPTFGVFVAFNLSPHWAIQPEINYLTTGERASETFDSTTIKYVESFDYLQVPVLVKFSFRPLGKITPVVFAGPAVAFLLRAHEKEYLNGSLEYDTNIKTLLRTADLGLDFGLGAGMALGKLKGLLDLRYYLGLVNVYHRPAAMLMALVENSLRNNAFVVTLGVMF